MKKIIDLDEYIWKKISDKIMIKNNFIIINHEKSIHEKIIKQGVKNLFGWKIHISASKDNYELVLKKVAIFCVKEKISFKFIAYKEVFLRTILSNSERNSSGKFITIYTKNEKQLKKYLNALYELLKGFSGPRVLSDKKFKDDSIIFYRYGIFVSGDRKNPNKIISNNGEIWFDKKRDYFSLPPFISDPYKFETKPNNDYLNGYKILKVLVNNNAGYVLKVTKDKKMFIIKSARPFILKDLKSGRTAIESRKHEKWILKKNNSLDFLPKYIESFYIEEDFFLVMEYIEGVTFQELLEQKSDIYNSDWAKEYKDITFSCEAMLKKSHEHMLILNDLNIGNLIWSKKEKKIYFIDSEYSFHLKDSNKPKIDNDFWPSDIHMRVNYIQQDFIRLGYSLIALLTLSVHLLKLKDYSSNVISSFLRSAKLHKIQEETIVKVLEYIKSSMQENIFLEEHTWFLKEILSKKTNNLKKVIWKYKHKLSEFDIFIFQYFILKNKSQQPPNLFNAHSLWFLIILNLIFKDEKIEMLIKNNKKNINSDFIKIYHELHNYDKIKNDKNLRKINHSINKILKKLIQVDGIFYIPNDNILDPSLISGTIGFLFLLKKTLKINHQNNTIFKQVSNSIKFKTWSKNNFSTGAAGLGVWFLYNNNGFKDLFTIYEMIEETRVDYLVSYIDFRKTHIEFSLENGLLGILLFYTLLINEF